MQVRAVQVAEKNGVPIKHRLLETVRACSTTPDAAADFFSAVLHPDSNKRLTGQQALDHLYLRRCVAQMQDFQHAQASVLSQNPCCISTDSHSLACASLPPTTASPALPCGGPKLSPLRSVLSKLSPMSVRSKSDTLDDCFPDYIHPSSDAELSAELGSVTPELHVRYQHSMDQLHSPHPHPLADFLSMDAPSAEPGTAKAAASLQRQGRDAGICSHYIEILPEDEEEIWAAEAETSIQSPGAVADICSHRIKILPEDEEETWVAEAEPSVQRFPLQAPSVQSADPPHIKGQQGSSHNTSMHPSARTIEALRPGFASVSAPAQQAERPHPTPDMTSSEGPPLGAAPRYASCLFTHADSCCITGSQGQS